MQKLQLGLFVVGSVFLMGCSRPANTFSADGRKAIQSRVTNSVANTVLFKPTETESNSASAFLLAPLIIQEVADTNAGALGQDQFESGDSGPLVYSESGTITMNGRAQDQFTYLWRYPAAALAGRAQGIRLTLNAAGEPVIWEVLADSAGADILYVAQSLELAARAEFGPPLPGRKFSIERGLADTPRTVVANVIDDGPTPMGPVVYLRQGTRDVSTLICRCMASQGGTLLGQTNYELRLRATSMTSSNAFSPVPLAQRLRLPRSF